MSQEPPKNLQTIAITYDLATHTHWLTKAEPLHRTLRPLIPQPYLDYMQLMFSEGARMAVLVENADVRALALYRCYHTTFHGRRFYVDDLVTDETHRSRGFGSHMLQWCEATARAMNADNFVLDSGLQRTRAHSFYYRHGLPILSFGFAKSLRS